MGIQTIFHSLINYKKVCHLIMKLNHQWTAQCSNSLCHWKSVFINKLGTSYSRSSALYFQFPFHCWDKSAVLFAFIFSSLFIKWLLVISISSILSSAVLNCKMKNIKIMITLVYLDFMLFASFTRGIKVFCFIRLPQKSRYNTFIMAGRWNRIKLLKVIVKQLKHEAYSFQKN